MNSDLNRRSFLGQVVAGAATAQGLRARPLATERAIGANDRIRIGIIGAGDRGQEDLKNAIAVPNVECVAMADVYTRRHDQVRQFVPNVEAYQDYRKLLDRKDIDAVIVASPLHLHSVHFLATIAAGKDLYSEKTMTWSIPEAVKCREAAQKSDRVVQIGLQRESEGALMDAKRWIDSGWLGKVTEVESWMSRNTPHGKGQWVRPVPEDCNPEHVDWNLFLENRPKTEFDGNKFINWRLFWEFSGGNTTENMIHQIAWIISALNLDLPSAASMMGGVFSERDGREVPDTIAVTLEYPDKVVTWQSTFSNSHFGFGERILGSDGTIAQGAGATDMVTGRSRSAIAYYPEKANRPDGEAAKGESKDQNHMANFFDCMRTRKQPNAPVEIGYKSAVAVLMSNIAYREKRRITLEEAMKYRPKYA
ncbi:MAG: Gfo/Idh/MocA family oxidoreductase [Acidobacteriaceae bacterium]|nr:Gfo/Idh/MocA family oxidoreductase [Acidobacteriaceae bacterium]